MPSAPPLLRVGLTGGIATGKSTVGAALADLGAVVVDADSLVHQLLGAGGSAVAEILSRFGPQVGDESGGIDRAALGRIVFADAQARSRLESLLHPRVRSEANRRFEVAARDRGCRVAVFDAALLVETGAYREFDRLIVTRCAPETQLRRLMARDGLSSSQARARIAAQAPVERKTALADFIIDTDGTVDATVEQTTRVFRKLEKVFGDQFPGER